MEVSEFTELTVTLFPNCVVCLLLQELAHPKASLHGMKNFLPLPFPPSLSFRPLPAPRVGSALNQEKDQQSSITWMAHTTRPPRNDAISLPFLTLLPAPPLIFHVKLSPSSLHFWLLLLARFIHSFVTRPRSRFGRHIHNACSLLLLFVSSM